MSNLQGVQYFQRDRQGQRVQCHPFHQQVLSHLLVQSGHQHPAKRIVYQSVFCARAVKTSLNLKLNA